MAFTIEQFEAVKLRVAELEAKRDGISSDVSGESAELAAVDARLAELHELLEAIACSPEGREEANDCFLWGMEAMLDDEGLRAIPPLETGLALERAQFRREGGSGLLLRQTALLLAGAHRNAGHFSDEARCHAAVLETMPAADDAEIDKAGAESAVRLALILEGAGDLERALDLLRFSYFRGMESEDAAVRNWAAWAAALLAERLASQDMEGAQLIAEEAVDLAKESDGREGRLAGAQMAMRLSSDGFGEVAAPKVPALAEDAVELARAAGEAAGDYGRQTLCFALLNRANVSVLQRDWERAAADLGEVLESCSGLPAESTLRELAGQLASGLPSSGLDDGDGEDDDLDFDDDDEDDDDD